MCSLKIGKKNKAAKYWILKKHDYSNLQPKGSTKWTVLKTYKIKAIANKGCDTSKLQYSWTFTKSDTSQILKRSDSAALYVNKFDCTPGEYVASVTVTEISVSKKKVSISQKCFVEIQGEIPVAIIKYGSERTVPAGMDIILDGLYSIDYNKNLKDIGEN